MAQILIAKINNVWQKGGKKIDEYFFFDQLCKNIIIVKD